MTVNLSSPIEKIKNASDFIEEFKNNGNTLYVKREDLLPFCFGGNKVRLGAYYLEDAKKKGCGAMVIHGSGTSNMCRVLAALCSREQFPCHVLTNSEDDGTYIQTCNNVLFSNCGFPVTYCDQYDEEEKLQRIRADFEAKGLKVYYIYDDDSIPAAVQSYVDAYKEITGQAGDTPFDYIFITLGTGITFSGLLRGQEDYVAAQKEKGKDIKVPKIVGVTISRTPERAGEFVKKYSTLYRKENPAVDNGITADFEIYGGGRLGGYGVFDDDVLAGCRTFYGNTGIGLDPIYSGKSFYAMKKYIRENNITGKKILFVQTGSAPLFLNYAEKIFK